MNAVELRIGNYIYDKNLYIQKVCEITDFNRVCLGDNRVIEDLQNCTPIPLTEYIFSKCGFKVKDDNPKQKHHYEGDLLVYICGFEFSNSARDGFYCYDINNGDTTYKYLHQIQNLYFLLTGEELKIEL